jgi:hypothetical protein
MLRQVTDPDILEQLNAMQSGNKKVNDPELLKQLQDKQGYSEVVPTFVGNMERRPKEFQFGTPQFESNLEDIMMNLSGVPGAMGMNLVGRAVPGIKEAVIGAKNLAVKGYDKVKNTISSARQDLKPFEEAAENAGKAHELAALEAQGVKPGFYNAPNSELQEIENAIGQHINIEGTHDVRAASGIAHRAKSVEDFWKDSYKQFEQKVKDAKFHMPEKSMQNLSYDQNEILRRIQQGADPKKVIQQIEKDSQNPFYDELISNAPTSVDTNAGDFLAKYKDFRRAIGGLKQDLKSDKYGSIEKKRIQEAIDKGKSMESEIKSALDEGLGEFKPEFDWVNKGYAEHVYPLRDNRIVNAAKEGKLSTNIIKDLRTNEPGMSVLREMVKDDPEILRNIIGQRYKIKPSEIHSPNEIMREYLDKMPEFRDLIAKKESALAKHAKRKDITLKEKIRAEKELKEIMQAKAKAKSNLKTAGWVVGSGAAATVGLPMASKLGKTLTKD